MLFQKYNLELTTDIHACIDHAFVNIRESVSVKRRLRTADCGPGEKRQTVCKMQTTDKE